MATTSDTQVMVETRFSATTVPSSVVVGGRSPAALHAPAQQQHLHDLAHPGGQHGVEQEADEQRAAAGRGSARAGAWRGARPRRPSRPAP